MSDLSSSLNAVTFARKLRFDIKGVYREGELRVFNLRRMPAGSWACECSVPHLLPPEDVANIHGEDPLDALHGVIAFVGDLIRRAGEAGVTVWWMERGDHGGFDASRFC